MDIEEVSVPLAGLPAAFDGFRIALASDIHFGRLVPLAYVRHVVRLIRSRRPDVVLLCGDTVSRGTRAVHALGAVLGELAAELPVLAVMGNHEYFGQTAYSLDMFRQAGIDVLVNRHHLLERPQHGGKQPPPWHPERPARLAIAGVDDLQRGKPDFAATLGQVPPGTCMILAGHSPDLADQVPPSCRVDLMLAGHTHGGQINLLGWRPVVCVRNRKYVRGLVQCPRFPMYISRGLGLTGLAIRLGSPPELPIITLRTP